jgi:hypothetical protein
VNFPLSVSDVSLWLAVSAIILLVTSELIFTLPEFSGRFAIDKMFLRYCALGCGVGFLVTVVMRVMGVQ